MSDKNELRELDAWIAEHVINPQAPMCGFTPTKCHGDAMLVLEKCATKCYDGHISTLEIYPERKRDVLHGRTRGWIVQMYDGPCECAETLPIAICLFAKKLFSTT